MERSRFVFVLKKLKKLKIPFLPEKCAFQNNDPISNEQCLVDVSQSAFFRRRKIFYKEKLAHHILQIWKSFLKELFLD